MLSRMCLRPRPRLLTSPVPSLAASLMVPRTLVATTTEWRGTPDASSACPRSSSDSPREYTSAVSKKFTPASSARRTIASAPA